MLKGIRMLFLMLGLLGVLLIPGNRILLAQNVQVPLGIGFAAMSSFQSDSRNWEHNFRLLVEETFNMKRESSREVGTIMQANRIIPQTLVLHPGSLFLVPRNSNATKKFFDGFDAAQERHLRVMAMSNSVAFIIFGRVEEYDFHRFTIGEISRLSIYIYAYYLDSHLIIRRSVYLDRGEFNDHMPQWDLIQAKLRPIILDAVEKTIYRAPVTIPTGEDASVDGYTRMRDQSGFW